MANTVAKGQVDLEVNKEGVQKDIAGLGGPLGAAFGKIGTLAGGVMGGSLGSALGKVTNAFPGGPLGVVATGVAVGAVAIGAALFGLGKEFDTAYKQIQKQTGATGAEFDKLKDSFKEVAKSTGASFEDIATAVGTVSQRTGATGADLEALSLSMLRMSSITGKNLGSVLESTTKLFQNFQIPVAEMPAAMDKLYVASAKTGVGVDQLSSSAQQFGPTLRQLGFGFDESIAMLANFDKSGINTGKVMSGMTMGVANLAAKGEKDIPSAFAKAVDAISSAESPTEAMGLAIEIFGKRAGPQLAEAIQGGALSIGDLTGALGDADGALKNTAGETATFEGKMAKFKNQMKVAFEPAAMGLFDAITDALISVTPWLTKFADLVSGVISFLTQNQPVFFIVAGAITAFGVALAVVTVITVLTTTAFGALALAVIGATWPILLIIAAVAILAVGIYLLWTKCETFRNIVTGAFKAAAAAFDWIVDAAKGVFNWVKSNWPILVAILLTLLGPIGIVAAAVFLFRDQIIAALGAVVSFFAGLPGRITGAISGLAGMLAGIASSAMSAFASAISGGIGAAISFVAGIPGKITGALGNLGGILTGAGRQIMEGLLGGIKAGFEAVGNFVGGIAGKIASLKGPLDYDRRLLQPAGKAIMGGLIEGLDSQRGALEREMAAITNDIALGATAYDLSGAAPSATALGGGAGTEGATYQLVMNVSEADVSQMQSGFRRLELLGGVA